jgi:hypothetical protein
VLSGRTFAVCAATLRKTRTCCHAMRRSASVLRQARA